MPFILVRANFENEVYAVPNVGNAQQQLQEAEASAQGFIAADETQEFILIETDPVTGDVIDVPRFYRKPLARRRR